MHTASDYLAALTREIDFQGAAAAPGVRTWTFIGKADWDTMPSIYLDGHGSS
jgi:hypothetical protein